MCYFPLSLIVRRISLCALILIFVCSEPLFPFSNFKASFEYGLPVQLECGGESGNVQDANETLILKTGRGKWFNSYVCTRGMDVGWKGVDGNAIYAARLSGIGGPSADWKIQFFLTKNTNDSSVSAPSWIFADAMGLVLSPSPDERNIVASFFAKTNRPRTGFDQPFLRKGEPLRAASRDILFGFCVDAVNAKIIYFAGDARGEVALTPEWASMFESGASLYLCLTSGSDAQPASAEFTDLMVFSGEISGIPKTKKAGRVPPMELAASASRPPEIPEHAKPSTASFPSSSSNETKKDLDLSIRFSGGMPSILGGSNSASVKSRRLVLETGQSSWGRSWVYTKRDNLGFKRSDRPMTFAVYPENIDGDVMKATLKLFLSGSEGDINSISPDYSHPNILGIAVASNSSGLGYELGLYGKIGKPNAGYEKPWFAIGKPMILETLEGPIGFSVNPRAKNVTLFAQTLSAQYALPLQVFPAFKESGRLFLVLNTGTAKISTSIRIKEIEIYSGEFRGKSDDDSKQGKSRRRNHD